MTIPSRRLSLKDGLSQATVRTIIQDRQGFMWFGTQDGLNRFDGYDFSVFRPDPADSTSIGGHSIWAVHEDHLGMLWVGTYTGLNVFDPNIEEFTRFNFDPHDSTSLGNDLVRWIHEDQHGTLWVATGGGGLNRYQRDSGSFQRIVSRPGDDTSLSSDDVNVIHESAAGGLWVGTNVGLDWFDTATGRFSHIDLGPHLGTEAATRAVTALWETREGELWIGRSGGGLCVLDPPTERPTCFQNDPDDPGSLPDNRITAVLEDQAGQIWIGLDGGGLARFLPETGRFERTRNDPTDLQSLSGDRVTTIAQDRSGVLWVGTATQGLNRVGPSVFKFNPRRDRRTAGSEVQAGGVRALLKTRSGEIWIGSEGRGIQRRLPNGRTIEHVSDNGSGGHGLATNEVYALLEDDSGRVWAGARNGWYHRFNPATGEIHGWQVPPESDNYLQNAIRKIIQSKDGTIWLGSSGSGLLALDISGNVKKTFRHVSGDPSSLSSDLIYALHVDRDDQIWVGTFGAGLNRLDAESGTFTRFPGSPTLPGPDRILAIQDDRDGNLWLGTAGSGLFRLDPTSGEYLLYTEELGLPSAVVYGILEDDEGHLWLTHNHGLSRFNPATGKFQNFVDDDGLQSNEFSGGAYFKAEDGQMFFGGVSGYNAFYPEDIQPDFRPPDVAITGMELFNNPVSIGPNTDGRTLLSTAIGYTDEVTLSHSDYVVSFTYASLSHGNPEKNQHAYMLEGLDPGWIVAGQRRFATYTNLPPGGYTFRVKASNGDGVWNEEGAALSVVVLPPFWATWWFRTLMSLTALGLAVGSLRWRERSIRERNRRLESEVDIRTAKIEAQKVTLEDTLTELRSTRSELLDVAHQAGMADIATGVLHNVGNILNSVCTSASVIRQTVDRSSISGLARATASLAANRNDLHAFFREEGKGEKYVDYLIGVERALRSEHASLTENSDRLNAKVQAISDVISSQQQFARGSMLAETLSVPEVVSGALEFFEESAKRHAFTMETVMDDVPDVIAQKSKLVHVLVNLIKNAKEALADLSEDQEKIIRIIVGQNGGFVKVQVTDNGPGIPPETLPDIFSYGYSTKEAGHGFGLHSCANYMKEMGGRLSAESDGVGRGSTFSLTLPIDGPGREAGSGRVRPELALSATHTAGLRESSSEVGI